MNETKIMKNGGHYMSVVVEYPTPKELNIVNEILH